MFRRAIKIQLYINTILSGDREREGGVYISVGEISRFKKPWRRFDARYELTGKEVFGYDGDKFEWRISWLRTAETLAIQLAEAEFVASPGIDIPRLPL